MSIEWTRNESNARVGTVNGQARFLIETTPARHFKLYQDGEYIGGGKLKALQAACEGMIQQTLLADDAANRTPDVELDVSERDDQPEEVARNMVMAAAESRTKSAKPKRSAEIDLEGQQAAAVPPVAVPAPETVETPAKAPGRGTREARRPSEADTLVQQSDIKAKISSRKAAKASHAKRLQSETRAEVKRFIESHGPQYFDDLRSNPDRLRSVNLTIEDIDPKTIRELVGELEQEKSAIYAAWVAANADPACRLKTVVEGHPVLDPDKNPDHPIQGEAWREKVHADAKKQRTEERIAKLRARKEQPTDYNDPTPVTTFTNEESETMATATVKAIKINETAARKLLGAVGIASDDAPLKKLQARVESLPDMAKEADFKEPETAAEKKLLKSIIDGLSSGKTIELATANGNGHAAKPTAKASKNGKAEKATKVKGNTKTDPAGVDKFGSRLGTNAAKLNAQISKKPKTLRELAEAVGLDSTCYTAHMKKLVEAKHVTKTEEGYAVK